MQQTLQPNYAVLNELWLPDFDDVKCNNLIMCHLVNLQVMYCIVVHSQQRQQVSNVIAL